MVSDAEIEVRGGGREELKKSVRVKKWLKKVYEWSCAKVVVVRL
jgi:hypothetical protein